MFSPIVHHTSICVLLTLVVLQDFNLEQLVVKTTFLHRELKEQIYMQQPKGFIVVGKEDHVCHLKKSLYGVKQSPRQWYKRFDSFMIGMVIPEANTITVFSMKFFFRWVFCVLTLIRWWYVTLIVANTSLINELKKS